MKLICNGIDLADSFSKVTKAITGRKAIPILEGVKLSAFGDSLTLTATDTDFTIENTIKAQIMLEGEIVVPGKLAAELIRKMSNQNIELDYSGDNKLNIKYIDSVSKINILNIEEFPILSDNDFEIEIEMAQKDLKDIINKTIFSASTDDSRPILKGCLLKLFENKIQCVALDGYRLAIATKYLNKQYNNIEKVIPAKALYEISKLIDDSEDFVKIKLSDKKIMVDVCHTRISSSLLEGDYIRYENIIPKQFNTVINVIKNQLEEGLDRASIISRIQKANLITIEVNDNLLTMYTQSEIGDILEKVSVSMTGKELKLGINSKYISDCLKAINDEYIKISFSNSTDPCIITPLDGEDFLYLILPVRILSY